MISERRSQCGIFLLLLLSADLAFIVVHFIRDLPPFLSHELFSLETDRGYSEIFQYVKLWWIVVLFAALWWRGRDRLYLGWMLLFAYLLGDDALGFHERGGHAVAELWSLQGALGLRGQDFGELAVSGTVGLVFLLIIFHMYLRSTPEGKTATRRLTFYVGVLAFFGVFIDMVHIMVGGDFGREFVAALEDGGEMFAVSIICWYVLYLMERRGNPPASLRQLARTALTVIRA